MKMRTVDDILKVIKKTDECDNFWQKLCKNIHRSFVRRRKNAEEARTFEEINRIPLIKHLSFIKARKTIDNFYSQHLQNLQKVVKYRKIRVVFLVNEASKWHCGSLYDLFENSNHFESLILVTKRITCYETTEEFNGTFSFFKNTGMRMECAYDSIKHRYLDLKNFSPDIVFYQQPWGIDHVQSISSVANFALTCYTPYCFHMMCSEY
ncbi:MAG: hypothetical protein LBC30_02350, partial [Puniceicoccales bacterium]|nr:hypothetical protein [Puniceicoccales bacterium]